MSPFLLRRYRADRLLREEFETLRGRVIGLVDRRLRGAGAALDRSDLEAAYAQAWQGLYAAMLEGRQIVNPAGWLAVVTHRRAIDEHRARKGAQPLAKGSGIERAGAAGCERDLAEELDDRARVRSLLEAMRCRLSERERQAAALCYLQGLSRADAAALMGVSESRMRKLMDGGGRGLRGVAAKIGALVQAIAAGEWCEEQGSLMRALAFGILDPRGERYRLALLHSDQCPACRSYVLSLRGLAVTLPPLPSLLHMVLGTGAGAVAGAGSGAAAGAGTATGVGTMTPVGSALGGGGVVSASGLAGAAGGGWWLAGGVGAKLAVGCLVALGVGAGCVALDGQSHSARPLMHRHGRHQSAAFARDYAGGQDAGVAPRSSASASSGGSTGRGAAEAGHIPLDRASREFGPERAAKASPAASSGAARTGAAASTASARTNLVGLRSRGSATSASALRASSSRAVPGSDGSGEPASGTAPAAQREFAPG